MTDTKKITPIESYNEDVESATKAYDQEMSNVMKKRDEAIDLAWRIYDMDTKRAWITYQKRLPKNPVKNQKVI
jgi:hypothetical protein